MRQLVSIVLLLWCMFSESVLQARSDPETQTRGVVDTVGFAHRAWQMDSVMARIDALNHDDLVRSRQPSETAWRVAICPHDDYTFAGWLYPGVLRNIKARTVIIFGVAHKARLFNLHDQLVFDRFLSWRGPYGRVNVSPLRDEIIKRLPVGMAVADDTAQTTEYSVEAMIPFLQYQNRDVEIVSILVPSMDFERMQTVSRHLARALYLMMKQKNLRWGEDVALLISSDAVHYGDEAWGGNHYAPYGTDSTGNAMAEARDREIIGRYFEAELTRENIARFYAEMTNPDDILAYRWTWCGRFSIPFGLLTSLDLQKLEHGSPLTGVPIAYATSISQPHLDVDDLGMGKTAIATSRHWVGYAAIGFK